VVLLFYEQIKHIIALPINYVYMQHLQPNTTLQSGKYRKLRISECPKKMFLIGRARAGYSIELVLGQGGFGITYLANCTSNGKMGSIKELIITPLWRMIL